MTTSCSEKAAELLHGSLRHNYCALGWSKGKSSYSARSGAQQLHGETGSLSTVQQESVLVHKHEKQVLPKGKMPPKRRSVKVSCIAPNFSAVQIGQHWEIRPSLQLIVFVVYWFWGFFVCFGLFVCLFLNQVLIFIFIFKKHV